MAKSDQNSKSPIERLMHDSCGLFGCILAEGVTTRTFDVARCVVNGLSALQHRGNESSGMVGSTGTDEGESFQIKKGKGLVREIFDDDALVRFNDCIAMIGHNRYSTAGLKDAINCIQPFVVHTMAGKIGVAHNGELVNAHTTRQQVLRRGVGLSTDSDSEVIAQLIAKTIADHSSITDYAEKGIGKELLATMGELTLSYSLVVMTGDRLYAVRDPWGNRPLAVGVLRTPESMQINGWSGALQGWAAVVKAFIDTKHSGTTTHELGWVISSETCAFQPPAKFLREIQPGEVLEITRQGLISRPELRKRLPRQQNPAFCIFEYVYFARPDSVFEGQQVNSVRERSGRQLATESPIDVDIVSNVPDSATPAALGYAAQLDKPYVQVLYKNAYVGRSFIQPSTQLRQTAVMRKFGVLTEKVNGKRIVLVDDSMVRGNTMQPIVKLLRDNGAVEVHIRLASPPLLHPCFMGVNIPSHDELIAHRLKNENGETALALLARHVGADSVAYLSISGLIQAVTGKKQDPNNQRHCTACLTGKYPVNPKFDW